jgi:5-methylthioribose kinase
LLGPLPDPSSGSNASIASQISLSSSPIKKQTLGGGHATKIETISDHDKRLAREGRWLLIDNAKVLQPNDFLRELFQEESS